MIKKQHFNLDNPYKKAVELEKRAKVLKNKGLADNLQEGVDLEVIRESQEEEVSKELTDTEKKIEKETDKAYYFSPEQEFNTEEYIKFLKERDLKIEKQARENLKDRKFESHEEFIEEFEDEKHKLKYFSVMFVSAPHISESVSGIFPGEPTPLMYATSVLDKYVRTDTFPAQKSPEILSMQNPAEYSDKFVKNFIEEIKEKKPRVVGVSNTSEGHYFAIELAKIVKQYSPETLVILGGSHEDGTNYEAYLNPSIRDKYNLTDEHKEILEKQLTLNKEKEKEVIDILVAGDGQYALTEVFKFIANNTDKTNQEIIDEIIKNKEVFQSVEGSGNIFVKDKKDKVNSISLSGNPIDWNNLPFMFRGRLTTENRFPLFGDKKTAQVMTQMGCKYACSFCMESLLSNKDRLPSLYKMGKGRPTPDKSLKEIEILIKDYGYEAVFFDDSTFTQHSKKTEKLLDGIIDLQKEGSSFEWGCQTTFVDVPDEEFVKKMKQAGCSYIYFGFEQIEEAISKGGKKVKLDKVEKVLNWCKEAGIRTGLSLQFGLEGVGGYKDTINYIAELYKQDLVTENSVGININTPFPGTQEWLELSQKGKLPDFSQKLIRHPRFETAHQLSNLTIPKANEIYEYAREKIGKGLIGIEFDNQEVEQMMEKYKQEFKDDFYFDWDYYQKYIDGSERALHLNHASISNKPKEIENIFSEVKDISKIEKEKLFKQAREKAAELVGVKPEAVVFGRNTTEAMKLVSWLAGLEKDDRVLLTNAENKSIVRLFEVNMDHGNPKGSDSWSTYPTFYKRRGKKYGNTTEQLTDIETDTVDVINQDLNTIYENIENNLTPDTKCFVISHVIRDTGVELPVKDIIEFVRKKKKELNPNDPEIFVMVDGAQALGNLPQVKFDDIGCDAYFGTPHKTMDSTPLGLGYFNYDNPIIKKNLPRLNDLDWEKEQVILKYMFDEKLGIEPNVGDEIDVTDTFGFYNAIQNLEWHGYKNGDFSQVVQERQELKDYFRDKIHQIVEQEGLVLHEVEGGTSFIYSFSIAGIDNKEFAHKLAEKGIFVSYIDRTKIQKENLQWHGNGVIRASFSVDNKKEEIDNYLPKIQEALQEVVQAEYATFEEKAEEEVLFKKPKNAFAMFEWLKEKTKSPIVKIATTAAMILTILISSELLKQKEANEIIVDKSFLKSKTEQFEKYQELYGHYRKLFVESSFPYGAKHRTMDDMGAAETKMDKYKLLVSLADESKLNKLLKEDIAIQLASNFGYNEAEKKQMEKVYQQTKNKKLEKLLKFI